MLKTCKFRTEWHSDKNNRKSTIYLKRSSCALIYNVSKCIRESYMRNAQTVKDICMHYEYTDSSCSVLTALQNLGLCISTDMYVCEQTNMHYYTRHMLCLHLCV